MDCILTDRNSESTHIFYFVPQTVQYLKISERGAGQYEGFINVRDKLLKSNRLEYK